MAIFKLIQTTTILNYLISIKINLKNNDFKAANKSLEYGLSYNFQIKNHPTYHLIKARIQKKQKNYPESLKTLQLAMQLPGVKTKNCKFIHYFWYNLVVIL